MSMHPRATKTVRISAVNPNSSEDVTQGLIRTLGPKDGVYAVPSTYVSYYTAGPSAPASIDNTTTSVVSAAACFQTIVDKIIPVHDAVLVCCFSDHPLTHMLREQTSKPVIGIFEAAISHALLSGSRFGIITTGASWKVRLVDGVRAFLGAAASDRFVGVETTGLGVLELHTEAADTTQRIKNSAKILAEKGADVIILGCAGMTGMEAIVSEGARAGGAISIAVIDGVLAGAEILAGLARRKYVQ